MADVITRLKLESGEYDSKIKRAVTGLQRMEDECRKVGGTLAILEKDQKQYVESLGRMQTVSTSVRGKIGELSNAYVELRSQYNRLTQEEKKGDFGKALSASLDQLKTRIADSKKELNDINAELGNTKQTSGATSQALEALAGKFGLNVSTLTKLGGALAVAGTALKVAKDSFFQTESNIDEWGRTVKGAEGAYDVFLQTLNNGNWSNFFQNLSTAVQGARDLYNALDKLGSIKGNNQAAIAIVQQQIAQLRLLKQQGKNVDEQLKEATQRLAQLQGQAVSAGKAAGKMTIQQTIRNGVNSMGGAAVSDKSIQAAVGGILTKGQAEFNKYARTVSQFENWSKAQRTVTRSDMDGNRWTERVFDMNLLSKPQQRKYKLAKTITDRETEIQKGIALYAQSVQEGTANAREEFKGNRYALQGATGGGSGRGGGKTNIVEEVFPEGSMKDLQRDMQELKKAQDLVTSPDEWQKYQQQIDAVTEKMNTLKGVVKQAPEMTTGASGLNQKAISTYQSMLQESMKDMEYGSTDLTQTLANSIDATTLSNLLTTTMQQGIDMTAIKLADGTTASDLWESILSAENIDDKVWEELAAKISEELKKKGKKGIKVDTQTGAVSSAGEEKNAMQQLTAMNTMVNSLGSIAAGVQNLGIKVPEGLSRSIAVLQTIMGIVGAIQAISTTKFLFSTGGIVHAAGGVTVPGNSFSGDNIPALLNSGEVVLTRAQAGVIADALGEGNGNQGGGTPMLPYVSGDKIILGANNFLKGAGKGELVTTSYLRQKGLI